MKTRSRHNLSSIRTQVSKARRYSVWAVPHSNLPRVCLKTLTELSPTERNSRGYDRFKRDAERRRVGHSLHCGLNHGLPRVLSTSLCKTVYRRLFIISAVEQAYLPCFALHFLLSILVWKIRHFSDKRSERIYFVDLWKNSYPHFYFPCTHTVPITNAVFMPRSSMFLF